MVFCAELNSRVQIRFSAAIAPSEPGAIGLTHNDSCSKHHIMALKRDDLFSNTIE